MMKNQDKICIIGAGIGGLTAGALLTKKGYRVDIFEKESLVGGRALSFKGSEITLQEYKDLLSKFNIKIAFSEPSLEQIFDKKLLNEYQLDLGYHAIGGGVLSNLNSVFSEIDDHIDIIESRVGFIDESGYHFPFLSKIDILKILPNLLRLLFSSEKTMKKLDKVSMQKTIKRYGKGKMKLILEVFPRTITTVNNLSKISTGEAFRAQKNLYKGSKPVGYPVGGLMNIHEKLTHYIEKKGGKIHLRKKIDKIIIENNTAKGVVSDKNEYFFDKVISNIMVQHLFDIAPESDFPKDYIKNIKSLKGTGSLCAYYSLNALDSSLIGKTFHFLERDVGVDGNDAVGMIDFMASSKKSGVSSDKKYLIQSYIICTPDEAKNDEILKKLKNILDKNLEILIPNYKNNLNWAIYPSIWHLDGVAKTIDNKKPDIKTPIENLFFVGDCVKAPGIGINCAINSARILSDKF